MKGRAPTGRLGGMKREGLRVQRHLGGLLIGAAFVTENTFSLAWG